MASKCAEKRRDSLNRFYTRTAVGEVLVEQLGDFRPRNVLDLGAGDGSLTAAVVQRWKDIKSVTVDLDASIVENLHQNVSGAGAARHSHYVHDVLDPALPSLLKEHENFDLAVCNPPFFRPKWSRDYARILQDAELATACPSTVDVTAEILFLAQNLRLLRDGGKAALIAPDSLLTGSRTEAFRRTIMDTHSIDAVLQLPNYSFLNTEARCFILLLTKNAGPTHRVKLLRYNADAALSEPIFIDRADGKHRMDFDFHSTRRSHVGEMTTLRQLGAEIKRGSLDTIARKTANFPTFHTTDYRNLDDGLISLGIADGLPLSGRLVIAEAGDILMARVDRSLHEKVGMVVSGRVPVTDCIYRVRLPSESRQRVFEALRSPVGAMSLLAVTKGVSARLLGKADLLDLPLKLPV